MGDREDRWLKKPFQMTPDGPWWVPPEEPLTSSDSEDEEEKERLAEIARKKQALADRCSRRIVYRTSVWIDTSGVYDISYTGYLHVYVRVYKFCPPTRMNGFRALLFCFSAVNYFSLSDGDLCFLFTRMDFACKVLFSPS